MVREMASAKPKRAAAKKTTPRNSKAKYWSADVTQHSDALDLEHDVFKKLSAAEIARSLKRSAERSARRKATPYQSAMSMLTFYINRAGKNLSESRLQLLNRAKGELRKAFGKPE
jgi:cob(I)alamin adenosyltransferase